MIRIHLKRLLGERKMTQRALSQKTGIRPNTISQMYYGQTQRLDVKQVERICAALGCGVSDLLEYVEDEPNDTL